MYEEIIISDTFTARCRDLPELGNGNITYTNSEDNENAPEPMEGLRLINTTAMYTCDDMFYLVNGSVNRTCQEEVVNGAVRASWTGGGGICIRKLY